VTSPPAAKPVLSKAEGPNKDAARRRLQMADIARLAGVSVSTVSRALNGSELVNAQTRERVTALARELNYSINLGAKNLRLQRNHTVAVVIPYDAVSRQHITDPFFISMLGGLADAITDRGYDMLLSRVDAENLDAAARLVDSGVAIGVILIGQWRHHDLLNQLAARKLPIVVWGAQLPRQMYCTVGGDNQRGGRLAAEHLLKQGRKRIVFLGDPQLPEVAQRLEGYHMALAAAKVTARAELELAVPFEVGAARAAVAALLGRKIAFDAVIGCSDLLAISAMQVLREHGRDVPRDVAVVGYDDMPLTNYCDPPLSSIHQPVSEAGVQLVDALLAMLHGQVAAPRVLPVELVVRRSSQA
jgi:DNA-binding LacI/PurR family transcriptional regulator